MLEYLNVPTMVSLSSRRQVQVRQRPPVSEEAFDDDDDGHNQAAGLAAVLPQVLQRNQVCDHSAKTCANIESTDDDDDDDDDDDANDDDTNSHTVVLCPQRAQHLRDLRRHASAPGVRRLVIKKKKKGSDNGAGKGGS